MKQLLDKYGISLELTAGYDSNANCYAERSIRTILEPARTIMKHMNVPWGLIDYAVDFVCYIKNRSVRRHDGRIIIALQELSGIRVELPSHLYTFGCYAWAHRPGDDM